MDMLGSLEAEKSSGGSSGGASAGGSGGFPSNIQSSALFQVPESLFFAEQYNISQ